MKALRCEVFFDLDSSRFSGLSISGVLGGLAVEWRSGRRDMEFTYNGFVRHGFGFANPNHAAALFALALPLCWGLRNVARGKHWLTVLIIIAESCLCVMLALTYSRSGFLALLAAGTAYFVLWRVGTTRADAWNVFVKDSKKRLVLPALPLLFFTVVAVWAGAVGRFAGMISADASLLNRFHLWFGGLRMLADNPFGVGAGLSGRVYTIFYQPFESALAYRTMVSSFLTPLVEFGFPAGVCVSAVLFAAMFSTALLGIRSESGSVRVAGRSLFASLVAITLCGLASTCFDFNILGEFGDLNAMWLNILSLAALGVAMASCFLGMATFSGMAVFKAGAISLSGGALAVAALLALGHFAGGDGLVRRVVRTHAVSWIEITPANVSVVESIAVFPGGRDIRGERELFSFLLRRFPRTRLMFPVDADGAIPAGDCDIAFLAGSAVSQAASLRSRLIIHHPTVPPPAGLDAGKVAKVFPDEFDESGYNAAWESWTPPSKLEYPE